MKAFVLGARHMSGTAKKSGNPYDFTVMFVGIPAKVEANANFKKTGVGLEIAELRCDEKIVPTLQQVGRPFPFFAELKVDSQIGRMNSLEAVVVGVEPLPEPSRAPGPGRVAAA